MLSLLLWLLNSWKWRFGGWGVHGEWHVLLVRYCSGQENGGSLCPDCTTCTVRTLPQALSGGRVLGHGLAWADGHLHSRMYEKTQLLNVTASRIPCQLTLRERKLINMRGTSSVNTSLLLGLCEFVISWTWCDECCLLWIFHCSSGRSSHFPLCTSFKCGVCVHGASGPLKNV